MRVLITNDDGIRSAGLAALAGAAVEAGLDVVVAAPHRNVSGASAAMTAEERDGRIVVDRRDLPDGPDVPAYAVAATPAFIVALAVGGALGPPPDLVLSGINRGPNLGRVVLHSGTVGAALAAGVRGRPALAVSLFVRPGEPPHWATARAVAARLLPVVGDGTAGLVLNVNVPNRPLGELAGMRAATLEPQGAVELVVNDTGEGSVEVAWPVRDDPVLVPGGDEALLRQGYATVTALAPVREVNADLPELPGLAPPGGR